MSTALLMLSALISAIVSIVIFGYTQQSAYLWLAFLLTNISCYFAGKTDE